MNPGESPEGSPGESPRDSSRRRVAEECGRALAPALEMYLDLHRSPELSGCEARTAQRLARALTSAGCDVTTGVGGHGVVGVLTNGPGPTVLLRADMDALPVEERTGLVYESRVTTPGPDGAPVPVMHACGHDLHTAALAASAAALSGLRQDWSGTLALVGQPAEETLSGARAMLADGLYERFPVPDVVLAQHVAPFPAGHVAHGTGPMTGYATLLDVLVHGRGGHTGMAHLAVNPIETVAAALVRIREWVHGTHGEVVVGAGALHAGVRANVVPETAVLRLALRAHRADRLEEATAMVREILRQECGAAGGASEPEVTVTAEAVGNINSPRAGRTVRQAHAAFLGAGQVVDWPPALSAEDFPLYGQAGAALHGHPEVETAYWMVGSVGRDTWRRTPGTTVLEKLASLPPNHSPAYAPDPVPTLRTAITAMVTGALSHLEVSGNCQRDAPREASGDRHN